MRNSEEEKKALHDRLMLAFAKDQGDLIIKAIIQSLGCIMNASGAIYRNIDKVKLTKKELYSLAMVQQTLVTIYRAQEGETPDNFEVEADYSLETLDDIDKKLLHAFRILKKEYIKVGLLDA